MKILVVFACALAMAAAQQRSFRPQPDRDFKYDAEPQPQGRQPPPPPPPPQPQPQERAFQQQPRDGDRYTTPIPIVRFDKEQGADGSYKTSYETGNNIVAEETGFLKNVGVKDAEALVQHGSYSYTAPDGSLITVTYTADEQGFRAEGSHLPTPPPVPEEIQKSLDIIYEQIRLQQEQEAREGKLQKIDPDANLSGDNFQAPRGFRQ